MGRSQCFDESVLGNDDLDRRDLHPAAQSNVWLQKPKVSCAQDDSSGKAEGVLATASCLNERGTGRVGIGHFSQQQTHNRGNFEKAKRTRCL